MHRSSPRNPRAEANPLRSLPLYRSAASVFGSSPRDVLVGNLRKAQQFPEGWAREYAKACAALGRANRMPAENRRGAQGEAMRRINAVRKGMKANLRAIAAAEAALDAYDVNPALVVVQPVDGPAWMVAPVAAPTSLHAAT